MGAEAFTDIAAGLTSGDFVSVGFKTGVFVVILAEADGGLGAEAFTDTAAGFVSGGSAGFKTGGVFVVTVPEGDGSSFF